MKKLKSKKITKKIIYIIIILILCNFIAPNFSYARRKPAIDGKKNNSLLDTISQFLCYLFDALMNLLQNMFVTPDKIRVGDGDYSIKYSPGVIFSGEVPGFDIDFITQDGNTKSNISNKTSVAFKLQPVIATWYQALRRIALVGLLSVIVYIGIRIILSSTSAKDKAKYKSMLKDWIVALCLLFTLHYIMGVIVTVVNKVNEVVKISSIAENGEDILMTTVRNSVLHGEKWEVVMPNVLIYSVLVVFTITYTIKYIRRVIHIAFLTMIAPLITLTYPLDKIKDNTAQAFDMWLKDYIFISLIQVVHLIIYYAFLGTAIDLTKEGNWLFAIVAIGFITVAEKLVKKMFGFEKSKSIGTLEAGATGALVMNAINQIPTGSSKGSSSGKQSSKSESANKPVRTAGANPFVNFGEDGSQETPENIRTVPNGTNPQGNSGDGSGSNSDGTTYKGKQKQSSKEKAAQAFKKGSSKNSQGLYSVGSMFKGAMAVTGKYAPTVAGATIKTMAGLTGGIFGIANAAIEDDVTEIAKGVGIGAAAGSTAVRLTGSTIKKIEEVPEKIEDAVDTYREGAYGKEVAQNAKFDRVFRRSEDYTELKESSGFNEKEFDQKVQMMLDEGIADAKQMKKILKNHRLEPHIYSMENSIKYSKMAKQCPEKVLYDPPKFVRFCQDRKLNLTPEEMAELRKHIMNFK